MRVYVCVFYGQDGYTIEGVFSTHELAMACLERIVATYPNPADVRLWLEVMEFQVDAA